MSTARSIRRAAERRAQKLARKQAKPDLEMQVPETLETSEPVISEARLEANRNNAQLSTGPKTEQGKAKSCKNAVKTALTGRTVLLPGDDADQYEAHLAEYKKIYRPVGLEETQTVQALADTWWRLQRLPALISALYAKGAAELADKVSNLDSSIRSAALRAETYLVYERQFKNLELQERRLFRQEEKLKAELKRLREEREAEELAAKKDRKPSHSDGHGFEFSTASIGAAAQSGGAASQVPAVSQTARALA